MEQRCGDMNKVNAFHGKCMRKTRAFFWPKPNLPVKADQHAVTDGEDKNTEMEMA